VVGLDLIIYSLIFLFLSFGNMSIEHAKTGPKNHVSLKCYVLPLIVILSMEHAMQKFYFNIKRVGLPLTNNDVPTQQ
jgi:hypothetical protein